MNRDTVQEIKDRLSIVDVIGGYIPLEKSGKQYRARCPFHTERTPSFYVNPDRNMFYCFGCQKGGDLFAFVEEIEHVDFKDALKTLAEKAGVSLAGDVGDYKAVHRLRDMLIAAEGVFGYCLTKSARASAYLAKRGISADSIARFGIGYAPKKPAFLISYLQKKGYTHDEMIAGGLAIKTDRGQIIDRFRGRLMFSLADRQGRIVGFTGRILPEFDRDGIAKYMNSPETELFHKSDVLFGFAQAKDGMRKRKTALLMEGQMDVVLAHQHGYENAIAISGTALSATHAEQLRRYAETVLVCLDADAAGVRAAEKNVWPLVAAELEVSMVTFPDGEDPASLLAAGNKETFDRALAGGVPYVAFILQHIKNIPLREQYKKIAEHVYPWTVQIQNPIIQDKILITVADALGVSPDVVRKSFHTWQFENASQQKNEHVPDLPKRPSDEGTHPLARAYVHALATLRAFGTDDVTVHTDAENEIAGLAAAYQAFMPDTQTSDETAVAAEEMRIAPMIESMQIPERVDFLKQTIKVFKQRCLETRYRQLRDALAGKTDPADVDNAITELAAIRTAIDALSSN